MDATGTKRIAMGDQWANLIDDGAPPLHADLICEARQYNGTFAIGLAAIILDGNSDLEARVLTRFRLNIVAAQNLHSLLGQMITDALKPADTTKAN